MLASPILLALSTLCATPAATGQDQTALTVTLSSVGDYARAGDTFNLALSVVAKTDTKISVGLLSGAAIQADVGGKKVTLGKTSSADVPFKKGAKLSLEIPVDLGALLKRAGKAVAMDPVEVKFSIAGHKESAAVAVVRDFKGLDVEQMDLTKTKVALVTNFGTMIASFRPDKAPNTVKNFVKLAKDHFYDGTRFHRVIKNFMIQGGDPNTRDDNPMNDGSGGPGYQIDAEFNDIEHRRGVLSMARSSDPNSAGSQFFVMHGVHSKHLDGKYTAFGSLTEGLDVLDRICNLGVGPQPGSGERSRPTQDVWLYRAVVLGVTK